MKRTVLLSVTVAAVTIIIGGCSRTEDAKTGGAERPAGAAVGTGGAGANVKSDGEFVHDVASKNMAEIAFSVWLSTNRRAPSSRPSHN